MKKISSTLGLITLVSVVISCSLINRFTPGTGGEMNRTGDLWPDVPRMDGLAPSDMEMPLMIKVLVRTALNNLWRFNKDGEDKTPATGDWIVFTTASKPADIAAYYTNARMTSFGNWQGSNRSTCMDGKDKGVNGVLCVFEKTADGKVTGLALIAAEDEKSKQTNLFFLRVERPEPIANAERTNYGVEH